MPAKRLDKSGVTFIRYTQSQVIWKPNK